MNDAVALGREEVEAAAEACEDDAATLHSYKDLVVEDCYGSQAFKAEAWAGMKKFDAVREHFREKCDYSANSLDTFSVNLAHTAADVDETDEANAFNLDFI